MELSISTGPTLTFSRKSAKVRKLMAYSLCCFCRFIIGSIFSKTGQIGTRDISFLHDYNLDRPLAITDGDTDNTTSLLPNEFQIVRSERVAGKVNFQKKLFVF